MTETNDEHTDTRGLELAREHLSRDVKEVREAELDVRFGFVDHLSDVHLPGSRFIELVDAATRLGFLATYLVKVEDTISNEIGIESAHLTELTEDYQEVLSQKKTLQEEIDQAHERSKSVREEFTEIKTATELLRELLDKVIDGMDGTSYVAGRPEWTVALDGADDQLKAIEGAVENIEEIFRTEKAEDPSD